jgi:hypothetical protein
MAGFKYLFITILFVIITSCSAFDRDQTQGEYPNSTNRPNGDFYARCFFKNIWRHPFPGLAMAAPDCKIEKDQVDTHVK